MDEPPKWTPNYARSKTLAERAAHAHERYRWHRHCFQEAQEAGNKVEANKQRDRMNNVRRHRDNLLLEEQWRKDNDILGS